MRINAVQSRFGRATVLRVAPVIGLVCGLSWNGFSQEAKQEPKKSNAPRTVTRLFWQDNQEQALQCGDVVRDGAEWRIQKQSIPGLPPLDRDKQSMVQMESVRGVVVVGVHDNENGAFQSGWIALNPGVDEEEHGNHSHWHFDKSPSVIASQLDIHQGNPAHVYEYQGDIYLANDKKNGFTILSPSTLLKSRSSTGSRFVSAGGGHITLAAVDNRVCYATWADRDGDNQGRVDVVSLASSGSLNGYSLRLPSGGLHGATANSGKVFFAPSDGICWVEADLNLSRKPSGVEIHHLSLGEDAVTGKTLRTGAFANHERSVLFTTGAAEASTLCILDASLAKPIVTKLAIPVEKGLSLTTPETISLGAQGKQYAFLFADRRDSELAESLHIVDLDPNGDGNYSDAKLTKSIAVGASKIEGHNGHHEICFVPKRKLAMLSNPGDGSIWVLSFSDLEVQAKISVSGTPTRLVSVGG